jgi:hypothetical protein
MQMIAIAGQWVALLLLLLLHFFLPTPNMSDSFLLSQQPTE